MQSSVSPTSHPETISTEEKDHLERSTKKIKSNTTDISQSEGFSPMESESISAAVDISAKIQMETVHRQEQSGEAVKNPTNPVKPQERARSFKAALLNSHTPSMECDKQKNSEFDSDSEEEDSATETVKTSSKIKVEFSREHLKRIRQNHKGCLIIKLLGRNMGFKALMDRMSNLWDLEGLFTPVDLGLGFYLIRFDYQIEYEHIHLICFSCGRVGHRKESCNLSPAPEKSETTVGLESTTAKKDEPKAVIFNGTIVSEEPNGKGYGEWMIVTRKSYNRTRPTAPTPNLSPKEKNNKAQSISKEPNHVEAGPSNAGPGEQNKTTTQSPKPTSKPTVSKPKPKSTAAQKRKGANTPNNQKNHKFQFNPLLKQFKPTYKPTSNIALDLTTNPSPVTIILDAPPSFSSSEAICSNKPRHGNVPPDISLLPTQTYHEFARSSTNKNQLPQEQNVASNTSRSASPSRGGMVDGRDQFETNDQGAIPRMLGSTQGFCDAGQDASANPGCHALNF